MHNPLLDRNSARVLVVEQAASVRMLLAEILRDLGFRDILSAQNGTEALEIMEVEKVDWLIMPLMEHSEVNAIQILQLITETPSLRHMHTSLLIDPESEAYCLGLAFEWGLFSWHSRSYVKESMSSEFEKLFELLALVNGNSALLAAEYIRLHLKDVQHHRSRLALEENLLALFPGSARVLLGLAEAEILNGRNERATITLNQALLLDEKLAPFCAKLRQEYRLMGTPDSVGKKSEVNLLGLKNVLVVDPDTDVLFHCEQMLRAIGVRNVQVFEDGKSASQWLTAATSPDLILMEWKIPNLSGQALIQRIRQSNFFQVPIIIMSSLIKRKDLILIKEMGVDELIEKPFEAQVFYKTIVSTLQQNRMPTEKRTLERKIYRLLQAKKMPEAESLMAQFLIDDGIQDLPKRMVEAEYHFAKGNFARAINVGMAALAMQEDCLSMLNLVGKSFLKLSQYENALKCFEKANVMSPANLERLVNIAEANLNLENHEAAGAAINSAESIDSDNVAVKEANVKLQVELGNAQAAQEIMKDLDSGAKVVAYLNNRAISLARTERYSDSVELYNTALASFPKKWGELTSILNYNLSMAYLRSNDLTQAMGHLKIAADNREYPISKKAVSLLERVEKCVHTGQKFNFKSTVLDIPHDEIASEGSSKPGELDLSKNQIIRRGDLSCYLIFRNIEDIDPRAKTLLKSSSPRFIPRGAFTHNLNLRTR